MENLVYKSLLIALVMVCLLLTWWGNLYITGFIKISLKYSKNGLTKEVLVNKQKIPPNITKNLRLTQEKRKPFVMVKDDSNVQHEDKPETKMMWLK